MYNDVDMVWLADPFPYLQGKHDVYFMDDMTAVSMTTLLFQLFYKQIVYSLKNIYRKERGRRKETENLINRYEIGKPN